MSLKLTKDAQRLVRRRLLTIFMCWKLGDPTKCPLSRIPKDLINHLLRHYVSKEVTTHVDSQYQSYSYLFKPTDDTYPIEVVEVPTRWPVYRLYRITPALIKIPCTFKLTNCQVHPNWPEYPALVCHSSDVASMFDCLKVQLKPLMGPKFKLCERFTAIDPKTWFETPCRVFNVNVSAEDIPVRMCDGSMNTLTTFFRHSQNDSWIYGKLWTVWVKFKGYKSQIVVWKILRLVEEPAQ